MTRIDTTGLGLLLSRLSVCTAGEKPCVQYPVTMKTHVTMPMCNPSTQEGGLGGSEL